MRRFVTTLLMVAAVFATSHFASADYTPVLPKIKPAAAKKATTQRRITLQSAQRMFNFLKGQQDISFDVVEDGCYFRAQVMASLLKSMFDVDAEGAWAMANAPTPRKGSRLFPYQANLPKSLVVNRGGRRVSWWYHCAPVITVHDANGKATKYVIDPSLFDRPVTIGEWVGAMMTGGESKMPHVRVTKPGEDPTLPSGARWNGQGKWLMPNAMRTLKSLDGMVKLRGKYGAKRAA